MLAQPDANLPSLQLLGKRIRRRTLRPKCPLGPANHVWRSAIPAAAQRGLNRHGHRHRHRRPRTLGKGKRRRPGRANSRPPPSAASPSTPCTRPTASTASTPKPTSAIPASIRSRAASMPPCTAAGSGPCASSPASARRGRPTNASSFLLDKGQTGLSTAFDLPTLMGLDSDDPRCLGEVGRLGVAVDTLDDMRRAVRRHRPGQGVGVDDHQRPGHRRHGVLPGQRPGPAASTGGSCAAPSRTTSSRSSTPRTSSSFRRSRHVRLVARRDRVLHAARAAVEHGQHQRLPHPRGRLDRRAGAGLHPGRRLPLRRYLPGPRPGHRRLRAAAQLLLQRPQRRLRGDRQVPGRPRALGRRAAQQVRRAQGERRGSCASTPRRPAVRCRTSSRRST